MTCVKPLKMQRSTSHGMRCTKGKAPMMSSWWNPSPALLEVLCCSLLVSQSASLGCCIHWNAAIFRFCRGYVVAVMVPQQPLAMTLSSLFVLQDFTGRQKDVYDIINLIRRFPLTVVHGRPRVGTSTATLAAARFLSERCSLLKPTALQKHFPQGCLWLTVCSKNIEDCIGYFLSAVATRCHTRLDHQLSSTGQGMAVLKRVQEWYRRSGMVDVELPPSYCLTVGERVATHIARLKQLDDHCDAEMLKRRTRSLTVAITLMLEVLALVKLFLVFDNAQLFINPSRPTSDKATASPHCAMFALLLVTIMEVAQPVHIVITARQSLNLDELFSHALQHAGAISPAMTEAATFFFQQSTVLSHPEGTKVISAFSAEEAMRLFGRGFDMQALQQLSKHQSWDSAVRAFCKANADNPDKIRKIRETVRLFKDTEGWVEKYIDLLLHRGGNERDH